MNDDDVLFKEKMHEIIQERTCITKESIDDPSGKPLRLLKLILDKVNLTLLDLQSVSFDNLCCLCYLYIILLIRPSLK